MGTIESIGSSTRIGGSKLTDREVEKLPSNLASQIFENPDAWEVACYAAVMDGVASCWQDIAFNVSLVKQLHKHRLRHSVRDATHRGINKTSSNRVAALDESKSCPTRSLLGGTWGQKIITHSRTAQKKLSQL